MIWKCAAPHHSSVGSCGKLWLTFTIVLQCPLYVAQYRRLLHANQKTEKRQRLDGSSGCGPKTVCSLTIQATLGSTCGQTSSLDWNIGVSEALECDNGASEEPGRVHLLVFMEFGQAVDWTSLRCVVFRGVRPDAAPCTARGPRLRQALDHGHFYVYANKFGTLRVKTSGYIPWEDYPVKGWWLDNLWTEHKLSHDVYLEYSCLGCSGRHPV